MERIPMTPEGYESLRLELQKLRTEDRAQNIRDIEEARAHGDLSENAEYHAAKEKQSIIDARIRTVEDKIGRAEVIDPKKITETDRVVFGGTITVYDLETEEELTYQIVGDEEADVKAGKVGVSSPIARALIGKSVGDETKVRTPKGARELEIVTVVYQ